MKAKQTQLFYMKTQHTFYTAVKITVHCYNNVQIDLAIVSLALVCNFTFYKENNRQSTQFYL